MIFLHNEYILREIDGSALSEDELVTALGKRLFRFVEDKMKNDGIFALGMLNEAFSMDEIARVSKMTAERNELNINDEESYDTYVRALREENDKKAADSNLSLEQFLAKKRSGVQKP